MIRRAEDGRRRCQVPHQGDAGADHSACANAQTLDHRRARSDKGAVLDRDRAAQRRAGRDMHVTADMAVVVDAGPRVDDAIRADFAAGLDDGSGHHLDAVAQHDAVRDPGCRVDERREVISPGAPGGVEPFAQGARRQLAYAQHQTDAVRRQSVERAIVAQHVEILPAGDPVRGQRRIADAQHRVAGCAHERCQDSGVATCAEQDEWTRGVAHCVTGSPAA